MEYPELVFSQIGQNFYLGEVFWNAMIRGYAFNGPHEKCIDMYVKMNERGLKPNNFTYPYVLYSFGEIGDYKAGKNAHCQIIKGGFECVPSVSDSLFNFYVRISRSCDDVYDMGIMGNEKLGEVRKIFDGIIYKNVEMWNRMIYEYANVGEVWSAKQLFEEMPERDVVSWNSMISGYAKVGDIENARGLFDKMPEKNVVSWTSMLGAYATSGDLNTATSFFEEMPEKNVVSWNSMLSSYIHHGKYKEALDLFVQMTEEDVEYDGFTLVSALTACAHLGALELGRWIHFYFITDWFQFGVVVGTALIEMYAKCGDVDRAFKIFIKLGRKDIFCWNVMIKSLAIHGRVDDAVKIFFMMENRGLKPNGFTFLNVLFACNHGGLVEDGRHIFFSMVREFGIKPTLNHYGCFIDLLGRNGLLEEAHLLLGEMPCEPDIAIWGALLAGCRIRNEIKLAEKVMEKIEKTKMNEPGAYALLSNIYASIGQWPEAEMTRVRMEDKKLWKKAGYSSVLDVVHV
ncbi:Pentatricopeptide repeat-containing protein [Thalictrum thalictroides]|uniref:Pentatricopeptide repeat-containing protein n=1 Tax=Thalictrum thalictroides TaxID=46969 RepID=A0A7J6W4N2_THATH|nr:Pentatricopeptide repeat-containing protein [Thalictrum thalictroides]